MKCNNEAVCDIAMFSTKSVQREKFLESCKQHRDTFLNCIIDIIEKQWYFEKTYQIRLF